MTEPDRPLQAMSDPEPLTRQNAVVSTVKLSWADVEEQFDSMFGDFEAKLMMGVPPPPEEWITPKKTRRPLQAATEADTLLQTTNPFTSLDESAARSPSPSVLRPARRPSPARVQTLLRCSSE